MNQLHAMRVFIKVAETHSFRRAAQQLDVSNALVTRCVAMLEAHLHTRLINRTTRNLALTEAGLRYLDGCRSMLEELDNLEQTLTRTGHEPGGTLRVVAAGMLPPAAFTVLVDSYRRLYPRVNVNLTMTVHPVNLIEDGHDVGIFAAPPSPASNLIERALGTVTFVPCASPAWLAEHGEPHMPAQLARCAAITLPPMQRSTTWHFVKPGETMQQVTLQPVYTVSHLLMVRHAALAGMGVVIVPMQLVADDLAAGTLKRLLHDYTIDDPETHISIVYPGRQHLPAKTRCFVDYTIEYFKHHCTAGVASQPTWPISATSTVQQTM